MKNIQECNECWMQFIELTVWPSFSSCGSVYCQSQVRRIKRDVWLFTFWCLIWSLYQTDRDLAILDVHQCWLGLALLDNGSIMACQLFKHINSIVLCAIWLVSLRDSVIHGLLNSGERAATDNKQQEWTWSERGLPASLSLVVIHNIRLTSPLMWPLSEGQHVSSPMRAQVRFRFYRHSVLFSCLRAQCSVRYMLNRQKD